VDRYRGPQATSGAPEWPYNECPSIREVIAMDQDIESLKIRVAALEKECRELSVGLHWAIEELRKKKLLPPYQKP
jgi:hypothetical protein